MLSRATKKKRGDLRREKQWRQGILKLVETAGGKRLAMKRQPGDFV